MQVIRPEPHHVFAWVELAKEFLEDVIKDYDWGLNEDDLHTTYHVWDKDYGFLLEDKGEIVGVLAGQVACHYFNFENTYFQEFMWYVKRDYRQYGGGIMLYRACVKRCKEKGITRIVFGHTRHMKHDFEKIFKSLGFTFLQSNYEKVM